MIVNEEDRSPQRRKRSAIETDSALIELIQDYLSGLSDASGTNKVRAQVNGNYVGSLYGQYRLFQPSHLSRPLDTLH